MYIERWSMHLDLLNSSSLVIICCSGYEGVLSYGCSRLIKGFRLRGMNRCSGGSGLTVNVLYLRMSSISCLGFKD